MEKLTLGKKIRLIREMKGLKQEKVAELLGMTQNGYGKIERDETDVPYSRLGSIAEAFGVSVTDLVNLEEQKIVYAINNHQPTIENMINHATTPKIDWEGRISNLESEIKFLKNVILNNQK
jgi:transcriptional regulator with XRE-family HTH domain